LINLAMEAAPRWNIKRLTDTYLSLSLGEIGREVGITSEAEVRSVVVSMVSRRRSILTTITP
jgi:COP9 signalosome complex subunit 3